MSAQWRISAAAKALYDCRFVLWAHCDSSANLVAHARLQFGIPYVGNCIRKREERRTDEQLRRDLGCGDKLPVPCSDGLCKATFVHCLRDVYEKEVTRA